MKDNTAYIVSGFMRTGTSMMMAALEAGGMEVSARESREVMRKQYADEFYDPNAGGLYELEMDDYRALDFPRQYGGKLIKCLVGGLDQLCVMPKIKIVFMRRDVEEVVQSYEAFFDQKLLINKLDFQKKMDLVIERMHNRKDVEIDVLWYRDVIEHPREAFDALKLSGWPIDAERAAAITNPELYRFRVEELEKGI